MTLYTSNDVRDVEALVRWRILRSEIAGFLANLSLWETERLRRGAALETSGAYLVAADDPGGHYDSPVLPDSDNAVFGCDDKIALRQRREDDGVRA
ncbi:MAG: hypothetical protein KAX65_08405 [Caldilineaceae bacterium]|nr:hypothetical protein [Caldilineaceae bacterium]